MSNEDLRDPAHPTGVVRLDEETQVEPRASTEPPIVARLVIEIRSDGTRTVARGALEDALNGERVTLEAHGGTPLALARSLMKSLLTTPLLARHAVRALLGGRNRSG